MQKQCRQGNEKAHLLAGGFHKQPHEGGYPSGQSNALPVAALACQIGQRLGSNLCRPAGGPVIQQLHQALDGPCLPDG